MWYYAIVRGAQAPLLFDILRAGTAVKPVASGWWLVAVMSRNGNKAEGKRQKAEVKNLPPLP